MRFAAALAHEAVDHREAETCTAMVAPRGEIGLEGLVHGLRRHADALVGDGDHQRIFAGGGLD